MSGMSGMSGMMRVCSEYERLRRGKPSGKTTINFNSLSKIYYRTVLQHYPRTTLRLHHYYIEFSVALAAQHNFLINMYFLASPKQ